MTNILTILLLTISLTTFGQTCDTINGEVINCVDTNGLRQGHWELTKKKILVSGHGGLGSKEGCRYFEEAEYYPLAKGEYVNDKKIGTWEYYSGDKSGRLERKIRYNGDGSIEDDNLTDRYLITISSDTLDVKGQLYHDLDTMNIDCQTNICFVELSNGQKLLSFEFADMDKLDFELLRIQMGVYNREIKKKKNAR
jgi:hypothetical protein